MKKVLLLMTIICFIGFTNSTFAQTIPSVKSIKVPSTKDVANTQMQALFSSPEAQEKVKVQLQENTELRDKSIDYLKNNPDTAVEMASVAKKKGGIKSKIMDYVLKNPELTKKVMDYIKNNPEMLKKAMSLIGM